VRRCLHSLLVGFLSFTMTVDVVRACGHRRHRCRPAACPVITEPAAWGCAWDGCATVVAAGCGPVVVGSWAGCSTGERFVSLAACESIACGTSLDCCPPVDVVAAAPAAAAVGDSVVAPAPAVEPVEPTPAAMPAAPAPVVSAVPDLEPVEPVSAVEPVVPPATEATEPELTMPADEDDAPQPVEPAVAQPAVVEPDQPAAPEAAPRRRNAFEDAEQDNAATTDAAPEPAAEPAPLGVDPGPAEGPVDESSPDATVPADAEPALEPQPDTAPAGEPEAAAEPTRRWIDDTASYAAVGRLVDIHGDEVEILKVDGRRVRVSVDRLSRFDRDYVVEAGPRIAARRPAPRAFDTASR
jgi:hypothetical protein